MTTNGTKTELPENERVASEVDLGAEFAALSKKFAEAFSAAWESEERHNIQNELAEGLQKLASQVNETTKRARETDVAQKVEGSVKQVKDDVVSGKTGEEVRKGLANALRGLGNAIDKMSESFTSTEEAPKE